MKKFISILLTIFIMVVPVISSGCGNGDDNSKNPPDNNEGGYQPNITENYEGTINVAMMFGETKTAWEAVVDAYNEFQPDVEVVLQDKTSDEYTSFIQTDLISTSGEIDIFQGNVVNSLLERYALDMYSEVSKNNQYVNDVWKNVLKEEAYVTAGIKGSSYILNSNSLITAWFYNVEAMNESGVDVSKWTTFDDMINACKTLKEKGYTHPLGLGGSKDCVLGEQFSWLLRIYGDQYYRDEYENIQFQEGDYGYSPLLGGFKNDLENPNIEFTDDFNFSTVRMYKSLIDQEYDKYVGPKSAKFTEFWNNMLKIKPYLPSDFAIMTHSDVRNEFIKNTKDSPVIFLDVLGFGAQFPLLMSESKNPFSIKAFDFLPMQGEYVNTDYVRDTGGSGGYISVRARDMESNKRNLDFVKFFMSPYGQEVYFDALELSGTAPEGISTIKDVKMPEEWESVFSNPDIKWQGLCDSNPIISNMITGIANASLEQSNFDGISKLFAGSKTLTEYEDMLAVSVEKAAEDYAKMMKWKEKAWMNPSVSPDA